MSEMQAAKVFKDFGADGGVPEPGSGRVLVFDEVFSSPVSFTGELPILALGLDRIVADPDSQVQIYAENLSDQGFRVVVTARSKVYYIGANYLAYPDPSIVRITGGSLSVRSPSRDGSSSGGSQFNLKGDNFDIAGGRDAGNVETIQQYSPSAPISLNSMFAGESTLGSGPAHVKDYDGKLYYTGQIAFTGVPLWAPDRAGAGLTVWGPFSMKGFMQGYKEPSASDPRDLVFNSRVAGRGTAVVKLSYSAGFFWFKKLEYNFGQ